MIAWFVKNPVAANCLMLLVLISGIYTTRYFIPLEVEPAQELDQVVTRIHQRGATPEDMEAGVSSVVEEALSDLPYIDELTSTSAEEVSYVTLQIKSGTDRQKALNEVKARVDALSTLPRDIDRPMVVVPTTQKEVLTIIVSGELDEREMATLVNRFRNDLIRKGIASIATVNGVRPHQISVNISEAVLREHQISRADVASAIRAQALDLGAGQLRAENGAMLIRSNNRAYRVDDFDRIVLKRFANGSTLKLGDIAEVVDGFDDSTNLLRYNGNRAAAVDVYRVGNESAIDISDKVRAYLDEQRQLLPETVDVAIFDDDARLVRKRLSVLLTSGLQGALLVMILLGLFLHPSVALWVVVGIPVCFAGALSLFPVMGITINVISLFSFILVLGVVVDDAIVTGENIFTHRSRGSPGIDAAINGTHEVTVPVVFGIVTTMLVFVPMLMLQSEVSAHAKSIGAGVIAALIFSLVESKLILPAHLRRLNTDKTFLPILDKPRQATARGLKRLLENGYQPLLSRCLKHRYLTVLSFSCVLLLFLSLAGFGWLRYSFFPEMIGEKIHAAVNFGPGTPLAEVSNATRRLENAAMQLREEYMIDAANNDSLIDNVAANMGDSSRSGGSFGWVSVEIDQNLVDDTDFDSPEIAKRWRELTGEIEGAEKLSFFASFNDSNDPIKVKILGNDRAQMTAAVAEVRDFLKEFSGVYDISDTIARGKPELRIELKPEAEILGLNLQTVTAQVRDAFFGAEAQRLQRGQEDLRVMVMAPIEERDDLSDLDDLLIRTPTGAEARFSDIASVSWGQSSAKIERIGQRRAAVVSARVDFDTVNMITLENAIDEYLQTAMTKYPDLGYSLAGNSEVERETNQVLIYGLLGVLVCIFALLSIVFKSWAQPFIIISVIPFALIGVFVGHIVMGLSLSMFSIFGVLALVGVVINDSLVLVDWINRRLREGKPLWEVVNAAGAARFRAILLTSLTTFFGLMPIYFLTDKGAQFLMPMATSLGFGILFATLITLLLVPCNYLILRDVKSKLQQLKQWLASDQAQEIESA